MIDVNRATKTLGGLALLKFFPADDFARAELVSMVCEMATTNEQIDWLVKRARNLWNEWEGPNELRALFCSRHKPADGVEGWSALPQFADGIPSERETRPQLAAATKDQISSGDSGTASTFLAAEISELCAAKSFNRAIDRVPAPPVREIPVKRSDYEPITGADVEQAKREFRAKRALDSMAEEGK